MSHRFKLYQIIFTLSVFTGFGNTSMAENRHFPGGVHDIYIANIAGIRPEQLQNIAPIVEQSIAAGNYPGAVVLAAHRGKIIYRGVFGNRSILPTITPMRFNTIFDLASLTKVVATTPAIMQLVEQGRINLDATVSKYWPDFANKGKGSITVRQLLTHTSGLPEEVPRSVTETLLHNKVLSELATRTGWFSKRMSRNGEADVLHRIIQTKLVHQPGSTFVYSDVNFITLAHLVERVSGERIDHYVQRHVFKPLGMNYTTYLPPTSWGNYTAPTERSENNLRLGEVHDPTAYSMGGVSGNAGLFGNAYDLGIYAQCLLEGGRLSNAMSGHRGPGYLLGPLTVLKMTTPQTPLDVIDVRGLGWDIDSYHSVRGQLFPIYSYGHTGWTGTSLWVDPLTQTWLVILTSRTHPTPAAVNQLVFDRRLIANVVAASLTDVSMLGVSNTSKGEIHRAYKNGLPYKLGEIQKYLWQPELALSDFAWRDK
ncbi:serine hydrolase domain-containing protein [soil metagenome]